MARTIMADTFNRWWAALDERARQEGGAKEWASGVGLRLSAAQALGALEACASPTSLHHDGIGSDGQFIRRVTAESDTVVLNRPDEGGDEFIGELIKNIVALTGIEPEYVDESVPGKDIDPMVERLREAREARDE
jgi:hypothetical protein